MEAILAYIREAGGVNSEFMLRFVEETTEEMGEHIDWQLDKPVVRAFRTDTGQQLCSLHVPTAEVVFNQGDASA